MLRAWFCLLVISVSCIRSKEPRPETMAGPDRTICSGSSTVLGTPGSPENSYNWSPSEGLDNPASPQPNAFPTQTITYTLTVTDKLTGISATSTVTVYVNPLPQADAGPSRSICMGDSTQLGTQGDTGLTYTWSPSVGLSDPAIAQPIASPSTTTTYTLTVTDSSVTGCSQTSSTTIIVNPLPPADAGPDRALCQGYYTPLGTQGQAGLTYTWTPSAGLNNPFIAQPTASPATDTTYTVLVTSSATGCSATSSVRLSLIPIPQASFLTGLPSCAGVALAFTDTSSTSEGALVEWLWNFGDGTTSTAQNHTHNYALPSTYLVTYTVRNSLLCAATTGRNVTIGLVSAGFTSTSPQCPGNSIQFTDTSSVSGGSIVSWAWDFGDFSASTLQNPSHLYATPGTYTVTFTASSSLACSDSFSSTATVISGPNWLQLFPSGSLPTIRAWHSAITDSTNNRMIVFGGWSGSSFLSDLRALSMTSGTETWSLLSPSGTIPTGRDWHSAIVDEPNQRMIIYGGTNTGTGGMSDVHSLNLIGLPVWTQLFPSGTPPTQRWAHRAIYDPLNSRMIVFGGLNSGTYFSDVWALSLTSTISWTQLFPTGTPPAPRRGHSMTYDPENQRAIIYGGISGTTCYSDVWALNLGASLTWTQLSPSGSSPGQRWDHSAVYDPIDKRIIIFDGNSCSNPYNDLWALNLNPLGSESWNLIVACSIPPVIRWGASSIYDRLANRYIYFGGSSGLCSGGYCNDTWELKFP